MRCILHLKEEKCAGTINKRANFLKEIIQNFYLEISCQIDLRS